MEVAASLLFFGMIGLIAILVWAFIGMILHKLFGHMFDDKGEVLGLIAMVLAGAFMWWFLFYFHW